MCHSYLPWLARRCGSLDPFEYGHQSRPLASLNEMDHDGTYTRFTQRGFTAWSFGTTRRPPLPMPDIR